MTASLTSDSKSPVDPNANPVATGWFRLAVSISTVGFIWLVVLPCIGTLPAVARHIQTQQQLNINPSALFYTELEESHEIAHRFERLQEFHTLSWNKCEDVTSPTEK